MFGRVDGWIRRVPAEIRGGVTLAGLALVGNLDRLTGEEFSFSIFYLVPLGFAARYQGGRTAAVFAAIAGVIWLTVEMLTHAEFSHPFIPVWNAAVRTAFFLLFVRFIHVLNRRDAWLVAEVRATTATLREMINSRRTLEREMAQAVAREHSEITRELHDGVGQYLAGLAFQVRSLADALQTEGSPQADRAAKLVQMLATTNRMLRRLDHILAPSITGADGLAEALGRLVADVRQFSGVQCTLKVQTAPFAIGEFQALTLFRIAQEAINNSIKHSGTGSLHVTLETNESGIRLLVADRGRGFIPESAPDAGEGLRIMRHRAEIIGATLKILSNPGAGCTVECEMRWRRASAAKPREA